MSSSSLEDGAPTEERDYSSAVDLICSALVILIPFSSFLGPSNSPSRIALVATTAAAVAAIGVSRRVHFRVKEVFPLATIVAILLAIQIANFEAGQLFFNYQVGLIVGLHALVIDRRTFARVATIFLALQLAAEIYEYLTNTLIFNSVSVVGDVFDADAYRGNEDVFRAKGFADGPTSVGFFLIFMAMMLRSRMLPMTLIMACCYLSSARLALLTIGTLYIVDLFFYLRGQVYKPYVIIGYIFAGILGASTVMREILVQENANFILQSLDLTSNDNNIDRLEQIRFGLSYIDTMSFREFLIGSSIALKNNGIVFESAWLGIITQSGIVLTAIYAWSLAHKARASWKEVHNRVVIAMASVVAGTFDPLGGSILMFMALGQSWFEFDHRSDVRTAAQGIKIPMSSQRQIV